MDGSKEAEKGMGEHALTAEQRVEGGGEGVGRLAQKQQQGHASPRAHCSSLLGKAAAEQQLSR